ncbi:MAG: hypothetical protein ACOZNI_16040 [Myxococcota bacterium]
MIWLLACGEEPQSTGASAEQYAGPVGATLWYAPLAEPDGAPRMLRVAEESWEVRGGEAWEDGAVVATWTRELPDELLVGDVVLLPPKLYEGASKGAATVESEGEWTVWYGTFPQAFELTIGEGDFAGTAVFAEGVGPIQLTLSGEELELTYYELESYE